MRPSGRTETKGDASARNTNRPEFEKRVTKMPDGRYLIYYRFPTIDDGFAQFGTGVTHPSHPRKT